MLPPLSAVLPVSYESPHTCFYQHFGLQTLNLPFVGITASFSSGPLLSPLFLISSTPRPLQTAIGPLSTFHAHAHPPTPPTPPSQLVQALPRVSLTLPPFTLSDSFRSPTALVGSSPHAHPQVVPRALALYPEPGLSCSEPC